MLSSRTSAARRLRRFLAPVTMSVLLHVFFVLQAAPALQEPAVESVPIDVFLEPAAVPTGDRNGPSTSPVRPAVQRGLGSRPLVEPPARPRRAPSPASRETRSPIGTQRSGEPHAFPQQPSEIPAAELELLPPAPPSAEPRGPASLSESVRPQESKPAVAPLYHQPPGAEKSGSMPPPAGTGAGFSFDFWSPPVFEEEMARATEKIGRAEAEHQRRKTTDLGHGVICNEGNGWFVCAHDDIGRCNRDHDGNCRYAEPLERYQLEVDHTF